MLAAERYDRETVLLVACYLQNNGPYRVVITQNNHYTEWKVYLVQLNLSRMPASQLAPQAVAGVTELLNIVHSKYTGCTCYVSEETTSYLRVAVSELTCML
jgi:hypothetical protein